MPACMGVRGGLDSRCPKVTNGLSLQVHLTLEAQHTCRCLLQQAFLTQQRVLEMDYAPVSLGSAAEKLASQFRCAHGHSNMAGMPMCLRGICAALNWCFTSTPLKVCSN